MSAYELRSSDLALWYARKQAEDAQRQREAHVLRITPERGAHCTRCGVAMDAELWVAEEKCPGDGGGRLG